MQDINQSNIDQSANSTSKAKIVLLALLQIILSIVYIAIELQKSSLVSDHPKQMIFCLFIVLAMALILGAAKQCVWSALLGALIITCISVQLSPLFCYIYRSSIEAESQLEIPFLIVALRGSLSILVAYGCLIGKITWYDLIWISIFGSFGYTFLELYGFYSLQIMDAGGTISIFLFGTIYGFCLSHILQQKAKYKKHHDRNGFKYQYISLVGVFLMLALWPLFNLTFSSFLDDSKEVIFVNSLVGTFGGISASFILWLYLTRSIEISQFLVVSVSSSILIGSLTNLTTNLWVVFVFGAVGSFCSSIVYWSLNKNFEKEIIGDSSWMICSYGIPSFAGSAFSVFLISRFQNSNTNPELAKLSYLNQVLATVSASDLTNKEALFIGVSLFIAVSLSVISGLFLNLCYNRVGKVFLHKDEVLFSGWIDQVPFYAVQNDRGPQANLETMIMYDF